MASSRGRFAMDRTFGALAVGQVIGWGVLYYSPLVAVAEIARVEGWSLTFLTSLLSVGMLVAAVAGIPVG